MHFNRWQIAVVVVLIVVAALGYLISPTVPIFIISVVGLPAAAFLLNRTPRPNGD